MLYRRFRPCTVISLVILIINVLGCGPSPEEKAIRERIERTKREHSATEIKTRVLPLFAHYIDKDIPLKEVPTIIKSLPIFEEGPQEIEASFSDDRKSGILFIVGSGFGHWGILICKNEIDQSIKERFGRRLIPWEKGVYFYKE